MNRCHRRGAKVVIDSAQTRPGIPSGPGATSREAILFVALRSSSCVTRSSSLHSVVSPEGEDSPVCLALLSRLRNRVPMTLASNAGSMLAVSGGARGRSFFTRRYGHPHGSDSTDSISSIQDRAFAILISRCIVSLISLYAS